jgi:hypothetical protein
MSMMTYRKISDENLDISHYLYNLVNDLYTVYAVSYSYSVTKLW